jgi:hypothetical protein
MTSRRVITSVTWSFTMFTGFDWRVRVIVSINTNFSTSFFGGQIIWVFTFSTLDRTGR